MKVVILGGTGTLGQRLITHYLKERKVKQIVCFSRDELKQHKLKESLNDQRVQFVLGDIRDIDSVSDACSGAYSVFNCAAYKRIPEMEVFPEESIKTNLIGAINAFRAADKAGASHFIFSSTDKAVEPINAYGMSKALAEKYLLSKIDQTETKIHIYRWGNVLGSRGSVIPYFANCVREGKTVNITDATMSRFWIKIEDAIDFMTDVHYWKKSGINLPNASICRSAYIMDIYKTVRHLLGGTNIAQKEFNIIGIRPGEKTHEKLAPFWDSQRGPFWNQDELSELISGVL